MRSFFSIIFLLFISSLCYAQHVYQIRADSVRIYNTCDTAELILENRTQKVPGFLFNKGDGRTEFQKLKLTSPGLGLLSIQGQDTINVPNIMGPLLEARYDLLSTNFETIPSGDSMLWSQWYANKAIGYFAYASPDMPVLSAQAFMGAGSKSYYNGLVVKTPTTGFDFAVNWNGELSGPNGAFIRIKDDTQTKWSPWRELLFKDYSDKSYILNQKLNAQTADLWISGAAKIGDSVVLTRYRNNATGDSVLSTDINGRLKLKFLGGSTLQEVTTAGNTTTNKVILNTNNATLIPSTQSQVEINNTAAGGSSSMLFKIVGTANNPNTYAYIQAAPYVLGSGPTASTISSLVFKGLVSGTGEVSMLTLSPLSGGSGPSSIAQAVFSGTVSGAVAAAGSQFVTRQQVTDSLSVRASNYIANSTGLQPASNFNISGNGIVGTDFSVGGGDINLTNTTSNGVFFNTAGIGVPTMPSRSPGTKLVLSPAISSTTTDYGMGMETGHVWNSVPSNSNTMGFKWYGGLVQIARLDGLGSWQSEGQGRFKGWYTANGSGPAAEIGYSGGFAVLYGYDRTAASYTPLRLGGGNTATGRYFDIDNTGYKFAGLPNTRMLGTDGLGYLVDNSASFIQNGLSLQAAANFNISGFGTASAYSATQAVAVGGVALDMYEGSNTGANIRWRIRRMNAEAAGDVGNDFSIDRFSNTGGAYGSAFSIKRSTGVVNMPAGATMGNQSGITGTNTGTANLSYLRFNDLSNTRVGYVGKGSSANNDIYLQSDAGNVTLLPSGGTGYLTVQPASMVYNGGQFSLNNGTANFINYSNNGVGAPAFTTRSAGTKAVWYPGIAAANVDFATGVENGAMWNSVPNSSTSYSFKWYGGITPVSILNAVGNQTWIGSGAFRGWNAGAGGPAAEIGVPGGYALIAGIDRTGTATYYPTTLRGGSGSGDGTGKDITIDGTGYKFTGILSAGILGTNASGYLTDVSPNFIKNQTGQQASSNFNISGAGVIGTTLNVGGQTTLNTVSVAGTTNMTGALTASGGVSTTAVKIKEGTANATMGVVSFGSGVISVTVNTTAVTMNSRIFLTPVVNATSPILGMTPPCLGPRVAGTSFTIFWTKEAVSSTGSVEWMIVEPY